jgi:hypothetical protein
MNQLLLKPDFLMPVDKLSVYLLKARVRVGSHKFYAFNSSSVLITTKNEAIKHTPRNMFNILFTDDRISYIKDSVFRYNMNTHNSLEKLLYFSTTCLDVEKGIIKNIHNLI